MVSKEESESPDIKQKRKHVRLSTRNLKDLKVAIRNEGLSAVANGIMLKDISIGGVGLTVPDAREIISTGTVLEFAVLLPNQDICWLSGSVVNVGEDICGVQFHENCEQKKLSRHILEMERELRGYERWGGDSRTHSTLSLDILESVWKDVPVPEGKKILFISTVDAVPSFITEKYEVMKATEAGQVKAFKPDLVLMDVNNLSFNAYRDFQTIERQPLLMETPVLVSIDNDRDASHITVRVSSGANTSFSMPEKRFEKEVPNILNVLLSKYEREKNAESGLRDRLV